MPEDIPEDSRPPVPELGKSKPEASPEPTPNQQAIEDLSWDIPFVRTIGNFFIRDGKAVKNGWLAVAIAKHRDLGDVFCEQIILDY
jgi:hypothetical protein